MQSPNVRLYRRYNSTAFLLVACLIVYALAVLLFAVLAHAQGTNAPTLPPVAPAPTTSPVLALMLTLIPVLVPLIIALGKFAVPKIPSWILPILAPAIGALIDYLTSLGVGGHASPIASALLGAAGVGVREIYDQVKGRVKDGPVVSESLP